MIDFFFDDWMVSLGDMIQNAGDAAIAIGLAALVVATEGIGAIPLSLLSSGFIAARAARDAGVDGMQTEMNGARRATLRNALYSAPTAAAAQSAWNTAIDGMTDVNVVYRTIWKVLVWSTWFNDLYDADNHNFSTEPPLWNLSGYDENACSFVGAIDIELTSEVMTTTDSNTTYNMIDWPEFLGDTGEWSAPALNPSRTNSWQNAPIGTIITVIETDAVGVRLAHPTLNILLAQDDSFEVTTAITELILFNIVQQSGTQYRIRVQVPA